MGCLRIAFGKGVCGTAAEQRRTQIVSDVHAIVNHIACDPNSRSEIVVPVTGALGHLMAVLDVDSDQVDMFDDVDQHHLEAIVRASFATMN